MAGDEPVWISIELALEIHREQIAQTGGLEGIRDQELLESALARPVHLLNYSDVVPAIYELAAAYAFGVARNHPYFDGNKRSAYIIMRTFLLLNGADIAATEDEKYDAFIRLAAGEMTEAELSDWLNAHLV